MLNLKNIWENNVARLKVEVSYYYGIVKEGKIQ